MTETKRTEEEDRKSSKKLGQQQEKNNSARYVNYFVREFSKQPDPERIS